MRAPSSGEFLHNASVATFTFTAFMLCVLLGATAAYIVDLPIECDVHEGSVDTVLVQDTVVLSQRQWADHLILQEVAKLNDGLGYKLLGDDLALAVARVENWSGHPLAVSSAGAVGIMQVHPPAWQGVFPDCGEDLFDPQVNACYGVRILGYYLIRHDGNEFSALAAYNGAVTQGKRRLYNRQVQIAREGL